MRGVVRASLCPTAKEDARSSQRIHRVRREVLTWGLPEGLVSLCPPLASHGGGGGLRRLRPRCPLHACPLRLPARRCPVQTYARTKGATWAAERQERSGLGQQCVTVAAPRSVRVVRRANTAPRGQRGGQERSPPVGAVRHRRGTPRRCGGWEAQDPPPVVRGVHLRATAEA